MNSIFFGNEVTVQLLELGHPCVNLKKVTDARRRQQLPQPTVRGSMDMNRYLLYCTAEALSVWSSVCPAGRQSVWAGCRHHGGPSAHRTAEEGWCGPGGWLQSTEGYRSQHVSAETEVNELHSFNSFYILKYKQTFKMLHLTLCIHVRKNVKYGNS